MLCSVIPIQYRISHHFAQHGWSLRRVSPLATLLYLETNDVLRFGNFIGEAEESEEDSQHGVDAGDYVYDDDPEEAPDVTGQELMEIDGL